MTAIKAMTSVTLDDDKCLVTALCNQPEAFALDLNDDHSRYFFSFAIPVQFIAWKDSSPK